MREALREARRAGRLGEVPVGAVVVRGGVAIGRGLNRPIAARDPTAHAEVVALRRAGRRVENYRLSGATLYVTVEPCLMCTGAIVQARVTRLVYGADDPKVGTLSASSGLAGIAGLGGLNHRFGVRGGVLAAEAAALLRRFFAERRRK
jgi:tRNA(adenine34) deaminase